MCQQYVTSWDNDELVWSIPWKVFVEIAVILSAASVEHFDTGIKCPVQCAALYSLNEAAQ